MNTLTPPTALASLSSDALDARLRELVRVERLTLVEFLRLLVEVDRRRLAIELGYDSSFTYCHEHLGLSRSAAFRRSTAARMLASFPASADYLADGRLNLSVFVELRDVLDPENHQHILELASGKAKEEVKLLVATLRPRPDLSDSIRKVTPKPIALTFSSAAALDASPGSSPRLRPAAVTSTLTSSSQKTLEACAPDAVLVLRPAPPPSVEPLSPGRYSVRFTASKEFVDELDAAKAAFSHVVPSGNIEEVLRECMRLALEASERRRVGASRPKREAVQQTVSAAAALDCDRAQSDGAATRGAVSAAAELNLEPREPEGRSCGAPSRHIPVEVRRQVHERDGGRCAFVSAAGKRCNSRFRLELHHIKPFALGGEATAANVSTRCRVHNIHHAYESFGEEHMSRFSRTRGGHVASSADAAAPRSPMPRSRADHH